MTTPARKLAKQGGAPTVNRMSLPRISVQGTMVFQKPHRRGAVGRQEARKRRPRGRRVRQGGAPTVNRMSIPRILVSRHYGIPEPHRRGAVGRQEARKRRLRGNLRSKAALLPLTACPYRVFLFKALWYSKSPTAEEPWGGRRPGRDACAETREARRRSYR